MDFNHTKNYLLNGGNLIMNSMEWDYTRELVMAAKAGGGHLTIVGHMGPDFMIEMAQLGQGHVTFDIASYRAHG